jgi:hypothetical protein
MSRIGDSGDIPKPDSRAFPEKTACPMEQSAVVAAPSQLRTITAPTLPRSNQIEATLFV